MISVPSRHSPTGPPRKMRRTYSYNKMQRKVVVASPMATASLTIHSLLHWALDGDVTEAFRIATDLETRGIEVTEIKDRFADMLSKLARGEIMTDNSQLTPMEKKLEEMEENMKALVATNNAIIGMLKDKEDK